jgi:hypothetical protein
MSLTARPKYFSALGQPVDMERLRLENESTVAVGNVRMNARGDLLDQSNNILVKREQIEQEYNRQNPKGVKQKPISLKTISEDELLSPTEALEKYYDEERRRIEADNTTDAIPVVKKGRRLVDEGPGEE